MCGVTPPAFGYLELRFTLSGTGTITLCTQWPAASAGVMKASLGDRMCLKQLINYAISVHRTGWTTFGHHLGRTNTNPSHWEREIPPDFQVLGENKGFQKIRREENSFS